MKVQGRRKKGRPKTKRRWLDRVRNDIQEKRLLADEQTCHSVADP